MAALLFKRTILWQFKLVILKNHEEISIQFWRFSADAGKVAAYKFLDLIINRPRVIF